MCEIGLGLIWVDLCLFGEILFVLFVVVYEWCGYLIVG